MRLFNLTALLLVSSFLPSTTNSAETLLKTFGDKGFDYTFGEFRQSLSDNQVRLKDPIDAKGGAGFLVAEGSLEGLGEHYLAVEITTPADNRLENFQIELIQDSTSEGKVVLSAKWQVKLADTDSNRKSVCYATTSLSKPIGGIGDYKNLDLSQVNKVQVIGNYQASPPFDVSIHQIFLASDVEPGEAYLGRSSTAAWRDIAAKKIDEIRKADLTIQVVDASGQSVPEAKVKVEMKSHEFKFGSAVQAHRLRKQGTDPEYKSVVAELFNVVTLENNLKWPAWEGEWGNLYTQSGALDAIQWLKNRSIGIRGHTLIWPGKENLPRDIKTMLEDNSLTQQEQAKVRQRIADHIKSVSSKTAGMIDYWDVINETRTNKDLMEQLSEGNDAMVDWFSQARSANPNSKLFINDYEILSSNESVRTTSQETYINTIKSLLAKNAEINGVGLQSHFTEGTLTGPKNLWKILDRFAALGLDLHVTEYDLSSNDEELQADYLRDFLTAIFAHEAIDSFSLWGFWEGAHWRPESAFYNFDWTIRPSGQAFKELVHKEWWTNETLQVDRKGLASLRGYKGEYLVTVSHGEHSVSQTVTLGEGGKQLRVTIDSTKGN